jgi:hypothetical protein
MKKWLITLPLSLILAIILSLGTNELTSFFTYSAILTGLIFLLLTIIIIFVQSIRSKKVGKAIGFFFLVVLLVLGVLAVWGYSNISSSGLTMCTQAFVQPTFRTNIFTGECSIGGGGSNGCNAGSP